MFRYYQDREKLEQILLKNKDIKKHRKELLYLIPELRVCVNCTQNNPVHIYNVYEHIEETVNKLESNLILRMAALLHDIGKPYSKTTENGLDRFKGHEIDSEILSKLILKRLGYDREFIDTISILVKYHNKKTELSIPDLSNTISIVGEDYMPYLLKLKNADLNSHSKEYIHSKQPTLTKLGEIYKNNFNHNFKF